MSLLQLMAARSAKNHRASATNADAASIWGKIGGWYPMQETSLAAGASIAQAYSGSSPLIVSGTGLTSVSGIVNNAIQSAGSGYASVASSNPMPAVLTEISLLCWFKTTITLTSRYFWGTWGSNIGIELTSGSSSASAIRALLATQANGI